MKDDSLLGYALLGLLHQEPLSGYDLRKIFATTALGSFSDSPGAIYPALRRLEARAWVRGTVQASTSLRQRRVYRPTTAGRTALQAWLARPVTRDDVVRGAGTLMLRFAFIERTLGPQGAAGFLRALARELSEYIPGLKANLAAHGRAMPRSGRLALECGIQEYEVRLRWAQRSAALYARKRKQP